MGRVPSARTVFRSTFSPVIAVMTIGGAVVAATIIGVTEGLSGALAAAPVLGLVAFGGWAAYARPAVIVDTEAVTLIGVARTVRIPWSRVAAVDTRWALAVHTDEARYTAWAAPAPGRHSVFTVTRSENRHLSREAYLSGTIRVGDAITSDSGQAAEIVRTAWAAHRAAGESDSGHREQVEVRWHGFTLAVATILVAVAVLVAL